MKAAVQVDAAWNTVLRGIGTLFQMVKMAFGTSRFTE
jgi:hypothetical protein